MSLSSSNKSYGSVKDDGTRRSGKADVHAHFVPPFYAQALRDAGHSNPDGMPAIPEWNVDRHLEFMDKNDVQKAYLSISSPGVYLSVPSKSATVKAAELARRVNDYGSRLKRQYPQRLGFFASLPLPDIETSLAEIRYCFEELDPKPDGIIMMSNFYGMYFGDPKLDPVYKALNDLGVVIFEHPTSPCTEHNYLAHRTDGEDQEVSQEDWRLFNRPVASRQCMAPTLEFPFDSTRTFADLFYSNVPGRFTKLKWIVSHAGGGLIPTLDRIVGFSFMNPNVQDLTEESMRTTLDRSFYFDLAGPWPVEYAINALLRWVKYTNIVWGSDTPWTPWKIAEEFGKAFEKGVEGVFDEDLEKVTAIRAGNANRLFDS